MIIFSNLFIVVMMFLFFISMAGIGGFILKAFKAEPKQGGEYIIFTFAAGAVLFQLILLAAGKAGLFSQIHILGISVIWMGIASLNLKKLLESVKEFSSDFKEIKGLFLIVAAVLFLPRLLAAFFNVFIPPIAWDTMAYHYAIPYIYKEAGRVIYIPFMYHSNWPQGMEIVFAWAMIVYKDILANGVSFVFSFMMLVSVIVLGKRIFNTAAGFVAAAVLGSFLLFKLDASGGYVEAGLTFFETAALYAVFMFVRSRESKYLILGAVCAGGAASVKILGLFSGAFLPVFILLADYLPGGEKKKLYFKEAVLSGLAALAIASPWYIKSWLDTGNPVWPFAYGIFGGKNWPPELNANLTEYYSRFGGGKNLLEFLKLPVKLIYSRNMDGFMGANIIYLYLMLPFTLYSIVKRKDHAQFFLMLYCSVFVVFWFMGTQMTRFFFPGMAVMTVMAAGETERIMRESKNVAVKFLAAAIVIYLVLFSYPIRNPLQITGLRCFLGINERENFLKYNLDYYALYSRVNKDEGVKGRIVLFREIRGYHLKKDYMWGDPVNQGMISYRDTKQTLADLKANAVEYIIFNNNRAGEKGEGIAAKAYGIMDEIIAKHAALMYCENNVCLYKLISNKSEVRSHKENQQ